MLSIKKIYLVKNELRSCQKCLNINIVCTAVRNYLTETTSIDEFDGREGVDKSIDIHGSLLRKKLEEFSQNRPVQPKLVVTWDKIARIKRHQEIWANKDSVVHRLPEHYKQRYWKNLLSDREPVHFRRHQHRFDFDSKKNIPIEREDYPIIPIYPPEADTGLWGGEGVVKGYIVGPPMKRKKTLPRNWLPTLWWPDLKEEVLYSEILDRYMKIIVTERALLLIDDNFGLDFYILRTPEYDLCSKLGNKLKREMLLALARGLPNIENIENREYLLKRYEEFLMPEEEAEWVGLDLNEACVKLQDLEEAESGRRMDIAEKVRLEEEQVEELKVDEEQKAVHFSSSWKFW